MQKISFRAVLAQCGVGLLVIFLAFIGSFLIREARSFIDPGSGPGASGVLGPDVGVIGNPTDGIPGSPTLFQGQAAIKSAVDAVGGGGGVFTKCQVKFNPVPTYPICPGGYTPIQNYAMAKVLTSPSQLGISTGDTDDSMWWYFPFNGTVGESTLACTVCEK